MIVWLSGGRSGDRAMGEGAGRMMMFRRALLPAAGLVLALAATALPSQAAAERVTQGRAEEPVGNPAGDPAGGGAGVAEAAAAARAAGRRVEATELRSETQQVFANPDGTFTSETSALPERVRRGADWVPVDTTLRAAPDGTVRTVATPLELAFSGGGEQPLARIGDGTRSLETTWPGRLPQPVLEGSTATYPSVLPDVDLKITASVLGYSEVLVVKSRQAAADPALRRITFGARATGVTVRETAAGGLEAVTPDGTPVFHSPVPLMWDSSGRAAGEARPAEVSPAEVSPAAGGRQAPMGVEVTPGEVTVVPDEALLTRPDAVFPLYIDPQWSGAKIAWTHVDRSFPNQEYWNSAHDPEAGNYGGGLKRSFWRMNSKNVTGKHILKATFRITQNKSWGCTANPQALELWLTGSISSATTWSRQPAWRQKQDDAASDAGYSPSCPDAGIEFDATKAVTTAAASGWSTTTFGIRDADDLESSTYGWKGFANYPRLVVDYNTEPRALGAVGTSPGTPCATGASRPHVNAGTAGFPLILLAKVYDQDEGDTVRAQFRMRRLDPAGWTAFPLPGEGRTSAIATSEPRSRQFPVPALSDGVTYSYSGRADDDVDTSAWSDWCEFTVDTTDPVTLPRITSADYPADTPDEWHGGVGVAGAFTFAPGPGDPDVAAFEYAQGDPDEVTAATRVAIPAGQSSVTVQIAPRRDWTNFVTVRPVDRAGNVGAAATHTFHVAPGGGPVARWRFDETSGLQAADSAGIGTPRPVSLAGAVRWPGGRVHGSLELDGATTHGTTEGPVLRTDRGFTVAAWARLTDDTRDSTVISQAGAHASGFRLHYDAAERQWVFSRHAADTADAQVVRAASDAPPLLRVWTHLVGVYDAPTRSLRLYVDGLLQTRRGSYTAAAWQAAGDFQIGRGRTEGAMRGHFPGRIDDVQAWDRILSDHPATVNDDHLGNEIQAMAKQPPGHLAWWKLEEGTGGTAADAVGPVPLTLAGGAAWTGDGHDGGGALRFDGADDHAGTGAQPVLHTDRSYSVAAWVRLSDPGDETLPGNSAAAVSQDGLTRSGFFLGYRRFEEDGGIVLRWALSAVTSDSLQAPWVHLRAQEKIDSSALGTWVHLAAVYDQPARQLRFYVNGQIQDALPFVGWHAPRGFQVGRGKRDNVPADFFPGDVDDVHAYVGALTAQQVIALASGTTPDA
ncbi:LamG-like jellyroll fold domain-containing protein [Microtetraspora sp. NBRC 13810]|uniref:LamG-like jellyroll fold domain-containing protein n=1 Tax=Microtetraspora sp. NBRC 13810 TaxID=3030990 RepID=UPI0025569970|nr:LamG-like jellyroll fold domain-containing protein [Microtetraspora sp. NBRC 13810]